MGTAHTFKPINNSLSGCGVMQRAEVQTIQTNWKQDNSLSNNTVWHHPAMTLFFLTLLLDLPIFSSYFPSLLQFQPPHLHAWIFTFEFSPYSFSIHSILTLFLLTSSTPSVPYNPSQVFYFWH